MTVTCHVSPDAGWPVLREFLQGTKTRLTAGVYNFTAPHIIDGVADAVKDNRELALVMQAGESMAGKPHDIPEHDTAARYRKELGDRFDFAWASVGAGHQFASAYHIKGGGLEGNISPRIPWFDIAVWREGMAAVERRVCRVELDNAPLGTGFLVGPDAVLTNHHVLRPVWADRAMAGRLTCRFDFRSLIGGSTPDGVAVALHATDWLIDSSPPSPAEEADDLNGRPATADELDYALIRLCRQFGHEPLPAAGGLAASRRGWVVVPAFPVALIAKMPLMIVQYPLGQPLKLAVDTQAVIGTVADGNRVRYATNTEHGSSGSPVFDLRWNLVALHHSGDVPTTSRPAQFNQGIPIGRVRAWVARSGKAAVLDEAEPPPLPAAR